RQIAVLGSVVDGARILGNVEAVNADRTRGTGNLSLRFGLGWAKAQSFHTGQTPVIKENRQLRRAILHDLLPSADIVNA
ncbi:hypothetical protein ACC745_39235, partial [Rhizobium ruizarguesonis]